jgi:TRAP-type C4-dicarboxylate transport system permease small subunit
MGTIMDSLKSIDKVILKLLRALTIISFVMLTILVAANVFVRIFPVASLHWFDEIIELLYAYLVFYGASALWITREHFGVGDWIEKRIRNIRMRHIFRLIIELFVLCFVAIFLYYSVRLTILARDVTNVFAIPKRILYSCLPVSGFVMIIYSIRNVTIEIMGIMKPRLEVKENGMTE